jgi:hypothetical protein
MTSEEREYCLKYYLFCILSLVAYVVCSFVFDQINRSIAPGSGVDHIPLIIVCLYLILLKIISILAFFGYLIMFGSSLLKSLFKTRI